jgi:hypothetical protein
MIDPEPYSVTKTKSFNIKISTHVVTYGGFRLSPKLHLYVSGGYFYIQIDNFVLTFKIIY